ncbi:hypothetical protein FOZ62_003630, partial [Perkinsus olseni]
TYSYRDPTIEQLTGGLRLPPGALPGEWIVVKPRSGEMYRRWHAPERPRTPQAVAVEGGDENEETEANVDEDADAGKQKYLDEIRFLVEEGMCEEKLDTKVPTATQVDPKSGHEIVTNNLGSMIVTTPDGSVRTVIFPDHTRISTERSELGEKISVSKLGTPLCYISQNGSNALFTVELKDGSTVCVEQIAEGDEVAVKRGGAPIIKMNVNTEKFAKG